MTEQTNLCPTPEQDSTRNDNLPDSIKDSMAMMMTEMMASFKQDLLTQFEDYFSSSALEEGLTDTVAPENGESSAVADAVDTYLNAQAEPTPSQSTPFADLAAEFSTADKTGPPIDAQLANLVNELCKDQLPKAKLDAVLEQYHRPSNCDHLVSPKVNKVVWQQLNQAARTADNAMQRCQKLFLASVYAMLHACTQTPRADRSSLIHALVLAMSGNREINLRRREFLRSHLNSKYSALCNPSTPITSELFGDDINKEIDQLTKSSQLGTKLTNFRRARGSRFHPYAATTSRNFSRPPDSRSTPRSFQAFFGSKGSYRRRSGAKVGATQSRKPEHWLLYIRLVLKTPC